MKLSKYLLIKLFSKGPIFYFAKRTGLINSKFNIIKFRTMIVNSDLHGGYSTAFDDPRVTKIGTFLRMSKLDELPQLINVFKGDMSIVGPRPQLPFYTDMYSEKFNSILSLKPGLTDLAYLYFGDMDKTLGKGNVRDRYENIIEPKKNLLRLEYIYRCSFVFDLRIIIGTFFSIIGIKNITRFDFEKFH